MESRRNAAELERQRDQVQTVLQGCKEQLEQAQQQRSQAQSALEEQRSQAQSALDEQHGFVAQLRESLARAKAEAEERKQQLAQAQQHGEVRVAVGTLATRIDHLDQHVAKLLQRLDSDGESAPTPLPTAAPPSGKKARPKTTGSA